MKLSWVQLSRLGFFVVVGFSFGARDMCAGAGHPPPDDPLPADASPDGQEGDGSVTRAAPPVHSRAAT